MSNTTITIRTDPDLADKVAALALSMDRSRNWVIEEALRQYVETQAWQIEGIKAAIDSLDKGEGIPHEQVIEKMEALLSTQDKSL